MRGLWTHLERLGGGIGTRGPGESQIETDRRLARDRIAALKRRLERAEQTRAPDAQPPRALRACRTIALAGYTNAGKSTLLNALTDADVGRGGAALRDARPDHPRPSSTTAATTCVTDTVGFIRKLPHQLVEAFKATLEETANADLILHVVDASVPEEQLDEMIARGRRGARRDRRRRDARGCSS